jgi:branched-chain amino acid transport system permease protein
VNLSHGALYLLGGYIGYTVTRLTGNWVLALLAAGLTIAALGWLVERGLLTRVRGDLPETLLTVALATIIADLSLAVWGGHPLSIPTPEWLKGAATFFGITYPRFRYFLMAMGVAIALLLWYLLYRTKLGAGVRAGVDDRETVSALGVNITLLYSLVFVLSTFLAGIAGVMGGTYLQLSPGSDSTILTYSLVVIILGGMGSLAGTVVSAVLLGLLISFGRAFVPEYSTFLIFIPMAIVLAVRPQGLLGRETRKA